MGGKSVALCELSACKLLLLSVIRRSIEYGNVVWKVIRVSNIGWS